MYKDEIIITFDDDMIYDKRLVQKLYEEHLRYPETIICGRGHKILLILKEISYHTKIGLLKVMIFKWKVMIFFQQAFANTLSTKLFL